MIGNEQSRDTTAQDLASMGRTFVAYLRPAEADGVPGYAIHGADGAVLGFAPTEAQAVVALREHGMEVVSIH
jgi:hypothetical protein